MANVRAHRSRVCLFIFPNEVECMHTEITLAAETRHGTRRLVGEVQREESLVSNDGRICIKILEIISPMFAQSSFHLERFQNGVKFVEVLPGVQFTSLIACRNVGFSPDIMSSDITPT